MDPMQTVGADSTAPESSPENLGIAKSLGRRPRNNEALEEFAQNLTENIMRSFVSQMEKGESEEAEVCRSNMETFAEELVSETMERAVEAVCAARNASLESSAIHRMRKKLEDFCLEDKPGELLEKDTLIDPQASTHSSRPSLSQSRFVGSLDYPDAPPTTPLLPELEKSRHSFARKLKGGLAMVFLPSPPPPTPKDKEDDSNAAINDHQADLMERVRHSLSIDELTKGDFERTSVEAIAEALSCDIINWVLSLKNEKQNEESRDLHLLAQRMAKTVLTSSLDASRKCENDCENDLESNTNGSVL